MFDRFTSTWNAEDALLIDGNRSNLCPPLIDCHYFMPNRSREGSFLSQPQWVPHLRPIQLVFPKPWDIALPYIHGMVGQINGRFMRAMEGPGGVGREHGLHPGSEGGVHGARSNPWQIWPSLGNGDLAKLQVLSIDGSSPWTIWVNIPFEFHIIDVGHDSCF